MNKCLLLKLTPLLFLLSLSANGAAPPGHPSVSEANDALGIWPESELRNRGRVIEAIPSNSYVYLLLSLENGEQVWLAAPRIPVESNSWVRYSDGVVMPRFYSKKLKRNFANIIFVDRVEPMGI